MKGLILVLSLLLLAAPVCPQARSATNTPGNSKSDQSEDELLVHLGAAEGFQRKGDLFNAAKENRAVLGIALQRSGIVFVEEGRYEKARKTLTEALNFQNSADLWTNLAIACLRENKLDDALKYVREALKVQPGHFGARYMLGNILYAKEDYKDALPELEYVFSTKPDFEVGRALGFTYLSLKMIDKARALFEDMKRRVSRSDVALNVFIAKFYERTNYPADAERELKEALAKDPRAPKVNLYLGYLLMQHGGSGRLGEALEAFEREIALDPNDFLANFFAGVAASSDNKHEKAVKYLTKAISLNPDSGEAHVFLGQSQIALGDLKNAEINLRRAAELEKKGGKNTQARRTHFLLGRLLIRTGRREEGKKELETAGELQKEALDSSRSELERILGQVAETSDITKKEDPVEKTAPVEVPPERKKKLDQITSYLKGVIAQSYLNLGVIETQGSRLAEAENRFANAYAWDPDFPNVGRNLGIVRFREAKYKEAIEPLSRHLAANPNDALARKLLGSSYYLTGNYSEAVKVLKPIESAITADAELAYFYGYSLVQAERNPEAIKVFEKLAALPRAPVETLMFAGQGFMIAGEFKRAIGIFDRLLKSAPATQKANYFRGQCFLRLNDPEKAGQAFEAELKVNPDDPVSRYHLALSLIERREEIQRAVSLLEEAIRVRPDYADAHYQLGKIYLDRGETSKAISELELAARVAPATDYIRYQLSIAYRKASRKEDADRELKIYQKLKEEKRKTDVPMPMGPVQGT